MSPLDRYTQSIRELEAAKRVVFDIARAMASFGRQLEKEPYGCYFAGIDGDGDMAALLGTGAKAWDAATFPTPAQVNAAVRARMAALESARSFWDAIPEDMRICTLPPRP